LGLKELDSRVANIAEKFPDAPAAQEHELVIAGSCEMIPMLLNTDWGMYQKGIKSEEFNR